MIGIQEQDYYWLLQHSYLNFTGPIRHKILAHSLWYLLQLF